MPTASNVSAILHSLRIQPQKASRLKEAFRCSSTRKTGCGFLRRVEDCGGSKENSTDALPQTELTEMWFMHSMADRGRSGSGANEVDLRSCESKMAPSPAGRIPALRVSLKIASIQFIERAMEPCGREPSALE